MSRRTIETVAFGAILQGRIAPLHGCRLGELSRLVPALAEGQSTHAGPARRGILVWQRLQDY